MIGPRPPVPPDDLVVHYLTVEPQIVFRVAQQLGADVFDVETILKRLADAGLVVRHPAGPGIPVRWSLCRS